MTLRVEVDTQATGFLLTIWTKSGNGHWKPKASVFVGPVQLDKSVLSTKLGTQSLVYRGRVKEFGVAWTRKNVRS